MKKQKGIQFNCFSPPIMVATLLIEFTLAAYVLWRYKLNMTARLVVTALVGLATFQTAEYFVCTGSVGHTELWSRIGFVAIATLPPLGLHIMHRLAGKPNRNLVYTAYASMAGFIAFFAASSTAFVGHQCTGNYVIFQLGNNVGFAFGTYYYAWLFAALVLGARWANELLAEGTQARKQLQAVRGMMIGYLVFLLPTAISNTVNPDSRQGIPSVMCGFAVFFALILTLYVMPRTGELKERIGLKLDKVR